MKPIGGCNVMLWLATGLKSDPEIAKYLSAEEIDACFDPTPLLRHVDTIMARFGL